jgi:hypothetical protein
MQENTAPKWILKPSKEGRSINGKPVYGNRLTQEDIQRYKNQGYAAWFMEERSKEVAIEQPVVATESPKEERPTKRGVEKLVDPIKLDSESE